MPTLRIHSSAIRARSIATVLALSVLVSALSVMMRSRTNNDSVAAPTIEATTPSVPTTPTTEPAPPKKASLEQITQAKQTGIAALEQLSAMYPKDIGVCNELFALQSHEKSQYKQAISTLSQLITLEPEIASRSDVRDFALKCMGDTSLQKEIATIIEKHASNFKFDWLFEILTASSTPVSVKPQLAKILDKYIDQLDPILRVAVKLRSHSPCDRKKLLNDAGEYGDARSLPYLKPLIATSGCGFFRARDCYPCLGNRSELKRAIDSIEKRIKERTSSDKK